MSNCNEMNTSLFANSIYMTQNIVHLDVFSKYLKPIHAIISTMQWYNFHAMVFDTIYVKTFSNDLMPTAHYTKRHKTTPDK